jgi:hypothetical protein
MIKGADKTIKDGEGNDAFDYADHAGVLKDKIKKVLKAGDEKYADSCGERLSMKV